MFIKVTQSGSRRYAQLVESFRNVDGKPRQRTVCTLGRLEDGGEVDTLIAADVMSLIQTAKMNGIEPLAYLTDVLTRLPTHPNSRVEELLPTRWGRVEGAPRQ